MENHLFWCFVLTCLCPFNEIKVSPLTWKSPHALSFSGVRVPERRFLNSSFRLIVRICETSDYWSPKRTGLRSAESFAPRKECRTERQHFTKVKCRCWLLLRQRTVIFLSATPFLLFSWRFKCQTLMDSLQTGGFTNSEFSRGLQLCKHTNTHHIRRHQRTTPANDLCFVPSVTKKQTLAEWTTNGFVMASWLNLTKNLFTSFYEHHSEEPSSPSMIWSFLGASKMQFKLRSNEFCMLPQPQNKCILRQLSLEWYAG